MAGTAGGTLGMPITLPPATSCSAVVVRLWEAGTRGVQPLINCAARSDESTMNSNLPISAESNVMLRDLHHSDRSRTNDIGGAQGSGVPCCRSARTRTKVLLGTLAGVRGIS